MDTSPAWLCWSEGAAHGLSWLTWKGCSSRESCTLSLTVLQGIIMMKHQVILSAGTRFFVAVAWVLRHVLCGLVSVLWRNVLGSVNWDRKTHSKTSGTGRNKFYTDNEKIKTSDSLIQMVWQQTNIYGARITRKHTLSIQHNIFRENAGIGKFSLCHIKNSYFTMIIIII